MKHTGYYIAVGLACLISSSAAFSADPKPARGTVAPRMPQKLPDHPRLLLTKDSLVEIRQRMEKQPWAKNAFEKAKRNADGYLNEPVSLPDRGGQWPLWYACKKDAGKLRAESPTRHVCTLCSEAYSGWPYDDVIIGNTHNKYATALRDCGLVYQLTGQKPYADKAKEILLAYAQKYLTYPLHNNDNQPKVGGGRMMSQTLDESIWMIPVAQGADLIWDTLSDQEREAAARGLFLPAAEVIRSHKMKVHNIQCFKNTAVGLIGFLLGDSALISDAIAAPEYGYLTQMARGVSPDGVWYEGSWGYHFFTMSAVWPLTEAAFNCGMNLYGPEYKRMFEAPLQLSMPNWQLPLFNDTGETSVRGNDSYEVALARYNDPQFAPVLDTGRRDSVMALVVGKAELPKADRSSLGSRNYPVSGYSILRHGSDENALWLAFKYGPHGGGHGHPDKLNFVLYSRGQIVAPDPGSVHYSVPIHKEWYRTTIAHNTLVVDGQSQAETQGQSLAFLAGELSSASVADAGAIYPGVRFRRAVAIFGDDVVLFVDRVTCAAPHVLDLAYHNRGQFAEKPTGEAVTMPPKLPGYMHIQEGVAVTARGAYSTAIDLEGGLRSRFLAVVPDGCQVLCGSGVGRNKTDRVPVVIVRARGRELLLGWAVVLGDRNSETPQIKLRSDMPDAVEVTFGDRTCTLVSNPDMRKLRVGGKTVNAPLVCILKQGDETFVEQGKPTRLR